MDVIADSMMVIQARKDPVYGSERLQSYCWTIRAFGGITGALIAAFITEYMHPRWCAFLYSLLGVLVIYTGV